MNPRVEHLEEIDYGLYRAYVRYRKELPLVRPDDWRYIFPNHERYEIIYQLENAK